MGPAFRPTIETLEHRDAPVILIVVITPLELFTLSGISFPVYPGPASVTRITESDIGSLPESDTGALRGIPPGTFADIDDHEGVYSALRISVDPVDPGHHPPGRGR